MTQGTAFFRLGSRQVSTAASFSGSCSSLLHGARRSARVEFNLRRLEYFSASLQSLSFDDRCAHDYGLIRADLAAQGKPIGANDLMIAAIARAERRRRGVEACPMSPAISRKSGSSLSDTCRLDAKPLLIIGKNKISVRPLTLTLSP